MSEEASKVYKILCKEAKSKKVYLIIFGAILAVSLIAIILTSSEEAPMFPIFIMGLSFLGLIVTLCSIFDSRRYLRKSIKTLITTNSIQYIDEVLNKEYKSNGKICFSKHLLYVPGKTVLAYEDIVNIGPDTNSRTYLVTTIDKKTHHLLIAKDILAEFLQHQGHILKDASYNDYKEKIENFKETGVK